MRRHHGFDAPYTAYALPGQFLSQSSESGRADEFRTLNESALDGLNAAIEQRMAQPVNDPPKPSGIPGEIFFSLFADGKLDCYEWTGEFLKLRARIEAGVASARGRPGQ